ncbi:T9SS type A sorting domain-containing protein [Flavitalea sp. BT771]|uniref:PKD domain-containing protein n=1 Tax=Flavitalea sp. BT771 TaxID=3063329 RepID=UPI0026E385B5|nr:T9SS type A sorting domain-containing protein [Flavitalea sp. BT771]MDO6430590.1 T9SS type A sorting domain-containing protein [Flavitalea sp. BT771]MDV6219270.1 T9SS type A sorting domain-containing protein [Flavitalea sp. BT771]
MKKALLPVLFLLFTYVLGITGNVHAQFTQPNGTVIGHQTVIPVAVAPPGYAQAQALIYYPDDYNLPANANKRYPLYVFLHGAGEGASNDITEVNNTSLPYLIANGLKPYGIDSVTGDTVKFIVVSPHCASCGGSYSYPQLQYTIPYLYANYRVDTSCVFVGGLSAGGSGTWSVVMGNNVPTPPQPDTVLAKRITGIMPMANGGYDNAISNAGMAAALDTNLRRGLAVLYVIGDQDPGYNAIGYHTYAHADTTYGVPGRWYHTIIAGGTHSSNVWNLPFPENARVWSTTRNAWTQMWHLRKGASAPASPPVSNPGSNQTLAAGTTSSTLNGSASTPGSGHTLTGYLWSQVSGPNTSTITTPAAVSTTVTGLIPGTYVFSLKVTDNIGQTNTASVQVTVNASAGPLPNGTVVGNQTVIPIAVAPPGYAQAQALIYYPDDYNLPANASKRYPLYVFLHGAGEGASSDITEVTRTSLPELIAHGLKPYAIDSATGDTVKFIVVSPHCASCGGSYSYPQLQYTIPYLYANYRVDTSCVFVGGLSAGGSATWSVVMGNNVPTPPQPDTVLGKRITGIMPMANGGYDNAISNAGMAAALDTNLRRGLAVLYIIGDQDPGFNAIGYHTYAHADTTFGIPGRWNHKIIAGGMHDSLIWNAPFPLNARVWSTTQNAWTQMWNLRKGPPVSRPGNNQTLAAGTTSTTLNGSASTAGIGHSLAGYLWSQVSGPNTSTISTPATTSTTVTGLIAGTYVFSLKVTDNSSQTNTATVQVTVNAPVVPAGNTVRKVACTEYKAAYMYTDSSVRSFVYNTVSGHVEFMPFTFGGRKAVDVSCGFNQISILDDQSYVWVSDPGTYTCTRVNTDATGAAFTGNVSLYGYFYTYLSIRNDGSIWYWGGDDYHFYSSSGTTITAPKKLHTPPGVQFTRIATGNALMALTTTGDVYIWGKGDSNYVKMILPRPASDIAASHLGYFIAVVPDNIAVSTMGYPYAWGAENGHYLAASAANYTAPVACKSLWGMTVPIREISANESAIHYIDSLGNLYGLGDNVQGEIGNGQEKVNHTELYATPYAWDWGKNEMLTSAPVQVMPGTKFKKLFTGNSFVYYHYATDDKDSLYFWGRNKSFVGGDGVANGQEGTWPNALDVLKPSMRTPLAISPTMTTYYNFTPYTLTTPAQQSISSGSATLTATATASLLSASGKPNYGYTITKYQWTQVSGPSGATIANPNQLTTAVTGLTNGTYIFNIQTTDNNTATISARDTIVVTGTGGSALRKPATGAASPIDAGDSPQRSISLYPNPVAGDQQLAVEGRGWKTGEVKFLIYDLSGKVVKTLMLNSPFTGFRQTLPVSGLAKGVYLLSVEQQDGQKPKLMRFIVK